MPQYTTTKQKLRRSSLVLFLFGISVIFLFVFVVPRFTPPDPTGWSYLGQAIVVSILVGPSFMYSLIAFVVSLFIKPKVALQPTAEVDIVDKALYDEVIVNGGFATQSQSLDLAQRRLKWLYIVCFASAVAQVVFTLINYQGGPGLLGVIWGNWMGIFDMIFGPIDFLSGIVVWAVLPLVAIGGLFVLPHRRKMIPGILLVIFCTFWWVKLNIVTIAL